MNGYTTTCKTRLFPAVFLTLTLLLAVITSAASADDTTIGQPYTIHSDTLNEDRAVTVYLPFGYDKNEQDRYPVLYLLSGNNSVLLMHAASTMELLDETGDMPQMIIVAVGGTNGPKDYFPAPVERLPESGQAARFHAFLAQELVPWVESHYRTVDYRVLCGASNTGLFTIYEMLNHPGSFSSYLAASPSIGWTPEYIFDKFKAVMTGPDAMHTTLYTNYGTDDLQSIVLSAMPQFVDTVQAYANDGFRWKNEVIVDGGHVPYVSLYNGLRFIFDGWRYPREIAREQGLEGVRRHYENLTDKFGFDVKVPAGVLMNLGTDYIRGERFDKALTVFETYLDSYPNSARASYLVGECHRRAGDNSKAAEYYRKALDLDSTFMMARRRLQGLESESLKTDRDHPPES